MTNILTNVIKHPAEEPNRTWPSQTVNLDWVLGAIHLPLNLRADGRKIHLVDTGIAHPQHPELVTSPPGIIRQGNDYVNAPPAPEDPKQDLIDHGMALASVIASDRQGGIRGVAPGAEVTVHKVHHWPVLSTPEARTAAARAVRAAIQAKADVISISMGFLWAGSALRQAIADADDAGIIVVAAAGQISNHDGGLPCPVTFAPGCLDTVICPAAINVRDQACAWSGHGDAVDILAPGDGVWAARYFRGVDQPAAGHPGVLAMRSAGTSFSTAITAAVAALWINQHADLPKRSRPGFFRKAIQSAHFTRVTHDSTGKPINDPDDWGYGILNVDRLLKANLNLAVRDVEPCRDAIDEVLASTIGYLTGTARKAARTHIVESLGARDEVDANERLELSGDALAEHAFALQSWRALGIPGNQPLPQAPRALREALLKDRA